jgi:hypothetical protein
MRVRTA